MAHVETPTMGLVLRLARKSNRFVREDDLQLRVAELTLLGYLRDVGGHASQQALNDALLIDRNNLVLILNSLEDRDFISRTRDRQDRRRHIVRLTPPGTTALAEAESVFAAQTEPCFALLNRAEEKQLRDLLTKALFGT